MLKDQMLAGAQHSANKVLEIADINALSVDLVS